MAQLATVRQWNLGLEKWTLTTGYYDEWGFYTGNAARFGRKTTILLPKVLPVANWNWMTAGHVDIHCIGVSCILTLA